MNTGARLLAASCSSLCSTCRVMGWLFSSPNCNDGMSTLPFCFGVRVMIQRVVACLSPPRDLNWLTWRVPRTSNWLASGSRSGLPNWVTSADSRVSSTDSPEFRRMRSTLAINPSAWAGRTPHSSHSQRTEKRVVIGSCPDGAVVRTRICVAAARPDHRGSAAAIVRGPGAARHRGSARRCAAVAG